VSLRELFGIKAAEEKPQLAGQPAEGSKGRPWGAGVGSPARGVGTTPPWFLGTEVPFWTNDRNSGNNQGSAVYNPATDGALGPQDTPVPYSDPAFYHRVGLGYPGILVGKPIQTEINDGPAPACYRRYQDCRIMDSVPNRIGGGSSGGQDNQVVEWSLAGQLYGRPASAIISQPSGNQTQGVSAVPSVYARRTVG
jgi:hypothetical protein